MHLNLLINNVQNLSKKEILVAFQDLSDEVWTVISHTEETYVESKYTVSMAMYAWVAIIADQPELKGDKVHNSEH